MRVLIADDEAKIAATVVAALRSATAIVDCATTGEEALALSSGDDYDVVLLALNLPDMTSYDVICQMRAAQTTTPIIILSPPQAQPNITVLLLIAGADDLIAQTYDPDELIARMRAVLRRSRPSNQPVLQLGPLSVDRSLQEIRVNEQVVALTPRQYGVLELLALRRGMVLSRKTLMDYLYSDLDEPKSRILDVFICALRGKLAQAGAGDLISTVWAQGYRLEVTEHISHQLRPDQHRAELSQAM